MIGLQEDPQSKEAARALTAEEKEEQRAMAYTLEAEEATRMVRNRYGGALVATGLAPKKISLPLTAGASCLKRRVLSMCLYTWVIGRDAVPYSVNAYLERSESAPTKPIQTRQRPTAIGFLSAESHAQRCFSNPLWYRLMRCRRCCSVDTQDMSINFVQFLHSPICLVPPNWVDRIVI